MLSVRCSNSERVSRIIGDRPRFFLLVKKKLLIKDDLEMPRRPRVTLAGVPLHLIQRGNNRQACFFSDDDYRAYLNWLQEYAEKSSCAIHAYVLMTNHVHLLITPRTTFGSWLSFSARGIQQSILALFEHVVKVQERRWS